MVARSCNDEREWSALRMLANGTASAINDVVPLHSEDEREVATVTMCMSKARHRDLLTPRLLQPIRGTLLVRPMPIIEAALILMSGCLLISGKIIAT
jgi:hypothetical protein